MAGSTFRIDDVPVSTLGEILEACAAHPSDSLGEIGGFAGFSRSTASKAVPTLESLGLVGRDGSGRYTVLVDGVSRGMDEEARCQVIRRALLGFRPFEVLLEGLALGESTGEALRKARMLLGLAPSEDGKLGVLLKLGDALGIVEHMNGSVKLVAEFSSAATEDIGVLSADDVESEAKARLYNARRLGRAANNYLDEIDRFLLADALLTYESNPRDSVNASGQALEDFLREVARDSGLDAEAAKLNGAMQLADMLRVKGVIHVHHKKMVEAPATIRNATVHRKDKKSLTPWELTPAGAFAAHSMTLTAIRSMQHYFTNRRQTI